MSSNEHEPGAEFPYPQEVVFQALVVGADNLPGMHIHTQDPAGGRVVVGVGLTPGTEFKLPITVEQVGPQRTRLGTAPAPGRTDPERSAAAMERIVGAVSDTLKALAAAKQ